MRLLMIRHAEAEAVGVARGGDRQRPLTERGRRQFAALSRHLVQQGVLPDRILHSPAVRAVQTADIFREICGYDAEALSPAAWLSERLAAETLGPLCGVQVGETVALIGHEPDMSHCTSELIRGGRVQFSPGSVACLDFDYDIRPGGGRLVWLLHPKLF